MLNYAQSAREYLDFRYQGLTVAFENLEHNISRLEEDMTLLKSCQERVSDEIDHEVDEARRRTVFINSQQVEIVGAINAWFSDGRIMEMANESQADLRLEAGVSPGQLVLEDEGQAQIVLSKMRSSCEAIFVTAQEKIGRELAMRFDQLENTLTRSLNDAMRPIEMRIKEELSHAVSGRVSVSRHSRQAHSILIPASFLPTRSRRKTPRQGRRRVAEAYGNGFSLVK
jgi:hypothetical protein